MKLIKIFLLIIWALIGIIFWIPFLFRVILFCVFKLFIDSILIVKTDVAKISNGLFTAAQFYKKGFKDISDSFSSMSNLDEEANSSFNISSITSLAKHLIETVLFWSLTLISVTNLSDELLRLKNINIFAKSTDSNELTQARSNEGTSNSANTENHFLYQIYKKIEYTIVGDIKGAQVCKNDSMYSEQNLPLLYRYDYLHTGIIANETINFHIYPYISNSDSDVQFNMDCGLYFIDVNNSENTYIYINRKKANLFIRSSILNEPLHSNENAKCDDCNFTVNIKDLKPGIYGVYIKICDHNGHDLKITDNINDIDGRPVETKFFPMFTLK